METASNFKHHIVVHSYKGKVGTTASILQVGYKNCFFEDSKQQNR